MGFHDGQNSKKQAVKGHKLNEMKLFINMKIELIYRKNVTGITVDIKNSNNHWTTGLWYGTGT